jgi:hypothetical protein
MNKPWLLMLTAAVLGTSVAWAINYQRYAHRVARFGPFTLGGDVTPANVTINLGDQLPAGKAQVELIGESTYDFGMMAPGTEGEHVFIVKSVGEGDLHLRLGASTCKCTFGELQREALAPGEQTEIKLSWSVKEGETNFAQSAQLLTNDPSRVVIQLEIVGKVVGDVDVLPEEWTFGEVATGEPMEIAGTIYNFMDHDIQPTELRFTSEELTSLSEFHVEPFQPGEEDGIRKSARQGFRVKVDIRPGMRQGAVSQNLLFGFRDLDEQGQVVPLAEGESAKAVVVPSKGSIIGPLSMITSSKLTGQPGGGYVYDFGRVDRDAPLTAKTFVVLKGGERDNTNLRIGQTDPSGVIKATLGEPVGRGSMKLFPLEIELVPGPETISRLGNDSGDFGSIWIESDNPKVTKMRIALKFVIEGR